MRVHSLTRTCAELLFAVLSSKVIGLPSLDDVKDENTAVLGKVWIYYSDGSRDWVEWDKVKHLRRSPNKSRAAPASASKTTFQTKLFQTSRAALAGGASPDGDPAPPVAAIERDRVMPSKPPVGKRGRAESGLKTVEAKVSVPMRLNEFPNQGLRDSCGKLFCGACVVVVPNIKSSIVAHLKTEKHKRKLSLFQARTSKDIQIMSELGQYFRENPNMAGGTVPAAAQLYRYRITESFMAAGIDISKADQLRALLERTGIPSTARQHLLPFIPKVEATEFDELTKELIDQFIFFVYDGTTRIGELLNVVARWCTPDFELVQRLVCLQTFLRHLNSIQLAGVLTERILQRLKVAIMFAIGFARDSASVNGAAARRLVTTFTAAEDLKCVAHTLCHLGDHFIFELLASFMSPWITLIYRSAAALAIWKALIGSVEGYSTVRWYNLAEIIMQMAVNFQFVSLAIDKFLTEGVGQVTAIKLREIYDSDPTTLKLQMAAYLDVRVVVSTTYELEGDGLPIMLAYPRIETIRLKGRTLHDDNSLPNVESLIKQMMALTPGTKIAKYFDGHGLCEAKIIRLDRAESTLYPGTERTMYVVKYSADGVTEDLEEEEIRPLLIINGNAQKEVIIDGLTPGFNYFENRYVLFSPSRAAHAPRCTPRAACPAPPSPRRIPRAAALPRLFASCLIVGRARACARAQHHRQLRRDLLFRAHL